MANSIFSSTLDKGLERAAYWSLIGRDPILVGESGIGKSDGIRNVWAKLIQEAKGYAEFRCLLDWRVSALDALSSRGVPKVEDGLTVLNPPEELPISGPGYIFLDEYGHFPSASVAHGFYQLHRERRIGKWQVPDDVFIICATNTRLSGASIKKFDAPLRQRLAWIPVRPSASIWRDHFAIPQGIDDRIIVATHLYPELIEGWDGQVDEQQATGRELADLSTVLKQGIPEDEIFGFCHDVLGPQGAVKVAPFIAQYDGLISVPDVLADPQGCALPDESQFDNCISLIVALSRYARSEDTPKVLEYIDRLGSTWRALFAKSFPLLNDGKNARGKGDGLRSKPYEKWIVANKRLTS